MTVVSHVGNHKKNFILSCGMIKELNAEYHIAVRKTEDGNVAVAGGNDSIENLMYTNYNLKKFSMAPAIRFNAETTGELPFGGTLLCNKTAAMPMTFDTQPQVSSYGCTFRGVSFVK